MLAIDALQVAALYKALLAVIATVARHSNTAKGQVAVEYLVAAVIDDQGSRTGLPLNFDQIIVPPRITSIVVSCKRLWPCDYESYSLIDVLVSYDWQKWSENFFLHDRRLWRRVQNDCWFEILINVCICVANHYCSLVVFEKCAYSLVVEITYCLSE